MTVRRALQPLTALPLLAVLALGCQEPASTPTAPAAALDHQAREELPFHLEGTAALVGMQRAPDFGPPNFGKSTFDGRCSEPADAVLRFEVEGQATHLGQTTGVVEHCTQFDFSTGDAYKITDGVMKFTAANGDELRGEHFRAPGTSFEQVEWVGGTGRFTTARGNAVARPACDQAAGTCTLEIDGALAYDPW